jgi:hypothetical protein
MPADSFGVSLTGGALGGGDISELEPGVNGEEMHQALADDAGGAENAGAKFFAI